MQDKIFEGPYKDYPEYVEELKRRNKEALKAEVAELLEVDKENIRKTYEPFRQLTWEDFNYYEFGEPKIFN